MCNLALQARCLSHVGVLFTSRPPPRLMAIGHHTVPMCHFASILFFCIPLFFFDVDLASSMTFMLLRPRIPPFVLDRPTDILLEASGEFAPSVQPFTDPFSFSFLFHDVISVHNIHPSHPSCFRESRPPSPNPVVNHPSFLEKKDAEKNASR
jgi:hypothetical protein